LLLGVAQKAPLVVKSRAGKQRISYGNLAGSAYIGSLTGKGTPMRGHAERQRPSGRHSVSATSLESTPRVADIPANLLNILYDSTKAVPSVKYALGVVGMAAAGMLIIGFLGADWPKIIAILLGAMVLLFVFSLLVRSASKVKYAAEFLCWTVVIGVAAVAVGAVSFGRLRRTSPAGCGVGSRPGRTAPNRSAAVAGQ
jgi:hypothetical protein